MVWTKSRLQHAQDYVRFGGMNWKLLTLLVVVFFLGGFAFSIFLLMDASLRWIIPIGAFCSLAAVACVWDRRW